MHTNLQLVGIIQVIINDWRLILGWLFIAFSLKPSISFLLWEYHRIGWYQLCSCQAKCIAAWWFIANIDSSRGQSPGAWSYCQDSMGQLSPPSPTIQTLKKSSHYFLSQAESVTEQPESDLSIVPTLQWYIPVQQTRHICRSMGYVAIQWQSSAALNKTCLWAALGVNLRASVYCARFGAIVINFWRPWPFGQRISNFGCDKVNQMNQRLESRHCECGLLALRWWTP